MSYLIPHLGSLLDTRMARNLLKTLLIIAHLILAALMTYLLSGWLSLPISAIISGLASATSYIILRRLLL